MRNIVEYIVILVSEFAKKYSLSNKQAFNYISQHGGVKLVEDNYEIMHTLTFEDAIEGLSSFCRRNGGNL